tara:strand:+ start:957 stop:1283 length:327 start_codon:yes stop_codon:yes gene_type:complete
MLLQESIAAATAVVGYDLLKDNSLRQSDRARRIVAVGMAGSAAALDTEADLFIGQVKVGNIFNSATGAPDRDSMYRVGAYVPPNQEVHLYVVDAPATNPINPAIDFEE